MEPFYRDGLRFECHACGVCCTGEPGYVYVDANECRLLAEKLGIELKELYRQHVRRVPGGYSLLERPDGSCVFYDRGCSVYAARPRQCRTYPFWPDVVASKARWEAESRRCQGIGKGALYDFVTIEALLRGEGAASAAE
jgi:uncharacterized protein